MSFVAIKELVKNYGQAKIIQNVNFQIEEGECAALLGPNGAGKTTIIKMLTGIIRPTDGEILLNGQGVAETKHLIGYLPQHPTFYPWMTGKELLEFMGGLSQIDSNVLKQRIDEVLALVGLKGSEGKRISTYSGGMKQRLGIAQAIIHKPRFLIMDEPVSALDPLGRREVIDLMKEIKKETTILFSTHILKDAEELCDRICILHQGKMLANDSIENLLLVNQEPVLSSIR